jgi:phosphate:Na+ symporter
MGDLSMNYKDIFLLLGGLGLFIFGMNMMGDGLQKSAGEKLKRILEVLTTNRILGVFVGAGVTAIVQSSSATTVMIVGFVNAGLMNLSQAAGVIMGANIGTTITAQLLAFKLTDIAPLFLALGAAIYLFAKKKRTKDLGEIILGFGILFVGMRIMGDSMAPLKKSVFFKDLMVSLANHPFYSMLVGLGLTALVQSSSASTGIILSLALNNQITFAAALPMIFGTNIGTCITALLASIGTHKNAKRAALIHLLFNIIGTLLFIPLIGPLNVFIPAISGESVARQIANVHTLFNIVNTLVMIWFIPLLIKIVMKLIPGEDKPEGAMTLEFLDRRLLETPSIAVGQLIKEVVRMGSLASENLSASFDAFVKEDEKLIGDVAKREELVNFLEREITSYMVALSNTSLSEHQSEIVTSLFHVVNDIERIGDHADNLSELAEYRMNSKIPFSDQAITELKYMYETAKSAVDNSISALEDFNPAAAERVLELEDKIDKLEKQLRTDHIERLNKSICYPASGAIFLDVISNLERVGDHSTNIAQMVLETK